MFVQPDVPCGYLVHRIFLYALGARYRWLVQRRCYGTGSGVSGLRASITRENGLRSNLLVRPFLLQSDLSVENGLFD